MSLSPQLFTLIALFGPVYLFICIRRLQRRRAIRMQELQGDKAPRPFMPGRNTSSSRLLQRFTLPERAYLTAQRNLLLWVYGVMAYASFVVLASSLLPGNVNRYGLQQSLPERVWYSYLTAYGSASTYLGIVSFIAAIMAILGFITSGPAFLRTRPVSLHFLFWSRVGGVYVALLFGIATGALCSFLTLLVVHGAVWKHLFDSARSVAPNTQHLPAAVRLDGLPGTMFMTVQQSHHLMLLLQTSAPRLGLALVTESAVVFSSIVAAFALPPRFFGTAALRTVILFVAVIGIQLATILSPPLARVSSTLFLSTQLGHPSPYLDLIFPITLSFLLLVLAQQAAKRREL
jgi:hypothetical protein